MNLTSSFFDETFEIVSFLDKENKICTVRKKDTNTIYVKKEISKENADIYKKIMSINNPHVEKTEYVYSSDKESFAIVEYISGKTIHELLSQKHSFNKELAKDYCLQILDGLSEIHKNGIIHRDITPKNIIVTNDGVCKILDFDISRTEVPGKTQDTTILGTAGYAAPEQFGFQQTSERSDVYSVGVLFNVMLTGQLPVNQKVSEHRYRKIIEKSTSIKPEERYSNASQMARAIEANKFDIWLPGFRTGIHWKKVLAIIIYSISWFFFIVYVLDGLIVSRAHPIREISSAGLVFVISPFIAGNIFYWDQKIPVIKKLPKNFKIIIRLIVSFVIFYCGMELYVGVVSNFTQT